MRLCESDSQKLCKAYIANGLETLRAECHVGLCVINYISKLVF